MQINVDRMSAGRICVIPAGWRRQERNEVRELKNRVRAITIVSTDTDGEIIRLARDNPAVFGELYDRHAAALYRYAARRAGEFAADDADVRGGHRPVIGG